ncbi:glycoside hydrolase family 16 protein, partial [Linnemannia elongata AG-77]
MRGMVDEDTPQDKRTTVAKDGELWDLVFSDEFNLDGRSFEPGQDPNWEAVNLPPSTAMGTLEHYSSSAWRYTSGMLQSWNKMCFQGGILEVAVSLPGSPTKAGLKPRVFVLGNLARYGYPASMDGV